MSVFTVHLARTSLFSAIRAIGTPIDPKITPGLIHAETLITMRLGAPVLAPGRYLVRQIFVFAQWEDESAIDAFLEKHPMGKVLSKGWHVRLSFVRQWGSIDGFRIPAEGVELKDPDAPVIAVTLARLQYLQVPRFIHWGRPVEKLVRDHPGISLALAGTRPPRSVSTFTVWKSQRDMMGMVHGRSAVAQPEMHAAAMKERERKDFHTQFTTLRFKPIAEYGEWNGRRNIIPTSEK